MGCVGSKARAADDVAVADVYRPPATSVSLFDISAVEEPWVIAKNKHTDGDDADPAVEEDDDDEEEETDDDEDDDGDAAEKKLAVVTLPFLEKLEGYDLAPASWSEVSKALEEMKPSLQDSTNQLNTNTPPPCRPKKKKNANKEKQEKPAAAQAQPAEETHAALEDNKETADNDKLRKKPPPPELAGRRVVKDNPFLTRDREESNKGSEGAPAGNRWRRRDPFEGCPERRPPGASGGGVVLYTTTLRGVRRTFEDCERARELVEACAEAAGVPAVDERDVSLHGEYLRELRELVGDGDGAAAPPPPRLFVMGRYVGGAEECATLAESGKLGEMMRWAKARGEACAAKDGRGCMGCGGARFVPCWECGGSGKQAVVRGAGDVERCTRCNENGLMMCPICH